MTAKLDSGAGRRSRAIRKSIFLSIAPAPAGVKGVEPDAADAGAAITPLTIWPRTKRTPRKTLFNAAGITGDARLERGLGENPAVRAMFVAHLRGRR